MKIFFLALPILYLLLNGYLFWRLWRPLLMLPLSLRVAVIILFWLFTISLFVVIMLRGSLFSEALSRVLFNFGSTWMLFSFYLFLSLTLFDLLSLVVNLPGSRLLYAAPVTLAVMLYGYINYLNPKVEHINIECEGDFEPLRIVAVSDIHLGYGTGKSQMRRYAELIMSQRPELILIAGDLIDNSLVPLIKESMEQELGLLDSKYGVYMVPGNHEYISGIGECEAFLGQTPITLLRDSVVSLRCGVQIIGRDDAVNRRRAPLKELVGRCDDSLPRVLLDHQPSQLSKADSLGVTLQISGHTHHGQVWPLNILTNIIYEQSHGYRRWQRSHVWVSSGLSLWGPKFRIATRGDLAVITLSPQAQ